MSIVATDLVEYCSANMPNDDVSTSGGAIDTLRRPDFTQMAANDTIQAVSSNAGDTTQTVTITGRTASGTVVSETKTLNGTTAINFTVLGTVERILKVELSATCTGIVTIRRTTGPTTVRTIPAGERGFLMVFRQDGSDPSVAKDYYVKTFLKNTNGSLALLSAQVTESADPDNRITWALAAAVDDSGSVANRVTSPGLTFNDTAKNVPGTDLASGSAIGVWRNLHLPIADPAHRTTHTLQLAGQST